MKLCPRFFAILFILLSFFAVKAQENQTEIKPLREVGQKGFGCYFDNGVMSEEEYEKIRADKDCGNLRSLEVDFESESLLGFSAHGDCYLQVKAKVFKDEKAKKYTVEVEKVYGGCRAAGNFQGLLVVEKIPSNYSVEYLEKREDEKNKKDVKEVYKKWIDNDVSYFVGKSDYKTIDLKNCIQSKQFVIRNQTEFLSSIRPDASRDWCVENLPKIDFEEDLLIGIELQTDYCYRPKGLEYQIERDEKNKQLFFNISYDDPQGRVCRRLGFYDLALLVPKIPAEWNVKFDVKIKTPDKP